MTPTCCRGIVINTTNVYAASIRFRLATEAKGTPPINMASCVASIVACALTLGGTRHFKRSFSSRLYHRTSPPGSHATAP